MNKMNKSFFVWLALPFVLLLLFQTYTTIQNAEATSSARRQHFENIINLEATWNGLSSAIVNQRSYLLLGDEAFVDAYTKFQDQVFAKLPIIRLHLQQQHDPQQITKLTNLENLLGTRFTLMENNFQLRNAQNLEGMLAQLRSGRGQQVTKDVRATIDELVKVEESSIAISEQLLVTSWQDNTYLVALIALFVVAGSLFWVFWMQRTAKLKIEHELAEATVLYTRNLIEVALDPIVTINKAGHIMDINKATENITGLAREQLIGSDFCAYFTDPALARTVYRQAFTEGRVMDYPLTMKHILGRTTEVLYNASVYRDAEGEVAGVFAAARDMTATKKQEDALRQANDDLESFSYSVSHDLRAPLRAIDGFSAILREDYAANLDEEGQRLFQVVSDNAQKMGKLIEDILFLSRANRHEMLFTALNMTKLTQEVWDDLATERVERKIDFKLLDLPIACADTSAVREVIQNLLTNAIKFTRGHEPASIEIGGYIEGQENVYYVRDNGVGFDMAYAVKLFGLFQRLHSVEEFEGTGVGLAIVKRFVLKQGGRVWAESKVGEGATFWFTLPAVDHCNQIPVNGSEHEQ